LAAPARAAGPFPSSASPYWGSGDVHPFFRDSGSRPGQPSVDLLGGYAFSSGSVATGGVEASGSPTAAIAANFFIAGPLWGGLRTEWSRQEVERSGRPFYTVNTVAILAQLEWRFREVNSRYGGYLTMGFGANLNLADVVNSPRLDDGTLLNSVDIAHTACARSAIGGEILLSDRAALLAELGMRANQFAKTKLVTAQPRTILEGQSLSVWTLMGGVRFYF